MLTRGSLLSVEGECVTEIVCMLAGVACVGPLSNTRFVVGPILGNHPCSVTEHTDTRVGVAKLQSLTGS
jgi:hypothetical protein